MDHVFVETVKNSVERTGQNRAEQGGKVCFVVSVSSWLSSGYGMFVLREERTGERRKELIILIIELVAF